MTDNKDYVSAVGKRKESVARLRIYKTLKVELKNGEENAKKGDMIVNGMNASKYFSGLVAFTQSIEPLKATNNLDKYIISVKIEGGGKSGQLDALIHALSRALSSMDPKNRAILKKKGMLTRDARVRERRKVGMGGKARRKRQSPKR